MNPLLRPGVAFAAHFNLRQKLVATMLGYGGLLACAGYLLSEQIPGIWGQPAGIAILVSYLFAVYMTVGLNESLTQGFGVLARAIQRFSAGDLELRVSQDEVGGMVSVLGQIKEMSLGLATTFEQVRSSAQTVNLAAREIAAGHVNLSQRTEEQAATLEETASGMEGLAGTVKQNAQNCRRASELSRSAAEVAHKGAQTVHRAEERMGTIQQSSQRIGDIIGLIQGIAFQTNILALNAAVEAARAGEQGKGFAVVASEVRSLAQRSDQAAKEIKVLIEESVGSVSEGGKLVAEAGATINEIVTSVQEVAKLVEEIALASTEQNAGVEEISKAIVQMESVTQQNAALVEQATAATLSFEEEAKRLTDVVGRFKFASAAQPAAGRPAPRPATPRAVGPQAALPRTARPAPARPAKLALGPGRADEGEWKEF